MPNMLKKTGYKTFAFISNNGYLSKELNFDYGFDYYNHFFREEHKKIQSAKGSNMIRILLKKIFKFIGKKSFYYHLILKFYFKDLLNILFKIKTKEKEKPFLVGEKLVDEICKFVYNNKTIITKNNCFFWIHFMDVHVPYRRLPSISNQKANFLNSIVTMFQHSKLRYKIKFPNKYIKQLKGMYSESLIYEFKQIEKLLSYLIKAKIISLDNSKIILTSDHGEEFFERQGVEHQSILIPELLRIPLFINDHVNKNKIQKYKNKLFSQRNIYEYIVKNKLEFSSIVWSFAFSEEDHVTPVFLLPNLECNKLYHEISFAKLVNGAIKLNYSSEVQEKNLIFGKNDKILKFKNSIKKKFYLKLEEDCKLQLEYNINLPEIKNISI